MKLYFRSPEQPLHLFLELCKRNNLSVPEPIRTSVPQYKKCFYWQFSFTENCIDTLANILFRCGLSLREVGCDRKQLDLNQFFECYIRPKLQERQLVEVVRSFTGEFELPPVVSLSPLLSQVDGRCTHIISPTDTSSVSHIALITIWHNIFHSFINDINISYADTSHPHVKEYNSVSIQVQTAEFGLIHLKFWQFSCFFTENVIKVILDNVGPWDFTGLYDEAGFYGFRAWRGGPEYDPVEFIKKQSYCVIPHQPSMPWVKGGLRIYRNLFLYNESWNCLFDLLREEFPDPVDIPTETWQRIKEVDFGEIVDV